MSKEYSISSTQIKELKEFFYNKCILCYYWFTDIDGSIPPPSPHAIKHNKPLDQELYLQSGVSGHGFIDNFEQTNFKTLNLIVEQISIDLCIIICVDAITSSLSNDPVLLASVSTLSDHVQKLKGFESKVKELQTVGEYLASLKRPMLLQRVNENIQDLERIISLYSDMVDATNTVPLQSTDTSNSWLNLLDLNNQ